MKSGGPFSRKTGGASNIQIGILASILHAFTHNFRRFLDLTEGKGLTMYSVLYTAEVNGGEEINSGIYFFPDFLLFMCLMALYV